MLCVAARLCRGAVATRRDSMDMCNDTQNQHRDVRHGPGFFWNAGPSQYCGDPEKKTGSLKNNGKYIGFVSCWPPLRFSTTLIFVRETNVAKWHEKEPGACWCIPVLGPLREGSILRVGTRNGARSGGSWLVDARVWRRRPEWAWPEGGHGFGR